MATVAKQGPHLGKQLVSEMAALTLARIGDLGYQNACDNKQYLARGQTLRALRALPLGEGESCLVIAAGPSLRAQPVAQTLQRAEFKGAIIATDSALFYCLSHGIIPDLVVTLDPHAKRIVRWFGDPALTDADIAQDDYFSRQELDPVFADERAINNQMLELLDQYGSQINIALSSSAAATVVERVLETGMRIYWWNPMYDEPENPQGQTHALYQLNQLPCMNAGGNVGSACWMMAHAVLGKKQVALIGVDFGYYADTPYRHTQYYHEALALCCEAELDSFFIKVFNPHLQQWFYTDPAYLWYRNCFLAMAADADCTTYNCTGGGILFGDTIVSTPLAHFLDNTGQAAMS